MIDSKTEHWLDWKASTPEAQSKLNLVYGEHSKAGQAIAARLMKRGLRKPCKCGRMNPVACKICPSCKAHL